MGSGVGPLIVAWVLAAGVLHAVWNALAKAVGDKMVAFGLIGVACAVIAAAALPITGLPSREAVWFAAGSAGVHVGYELLLMRAYRLGAFGHTYPLARGTAPLLVAAGAAVFAHEHLSGQQIAGVVTVAAGLAAVSFASGNPLRLHPAATLAALATGGAIATYSVIDGLGVRVSHNPFGYTALLFLLQGPVLPVVAGLRRRRVGGFPGRDLVAGLAAGAISVAAYGIVVWAQTRGPLAVVSALRETSVISAAVIAAAVFREPFGWRRLPSALAVAVGIALINL